MARSLPALALLVLGVNCGNNVATDMSSPGTSTTTVDSTITAPPTSPASETTTTTSLPATTTTIVPETVQPTDPPTTQPVTTPPTAAEPTVPTLLSEANGRFCYAYDSPESWIRTEPDNGDGVWLVAPPPEQNVQVTFSGEFSPETFLESGEEYEYYLLGVPGDWEIIESTDSRGSFDAAEDAVSAEELFGWKMTVRSTAGDEDPMIEVRRFLKNGDFYISFTGAAPESVFPQYEQLFDRLAESLVAIAGCEF